MQSPIWSGGGHELTKSCYGIETPYRSWHIQKVIGLLLAADAGVIVLSSEDEAFICAVLDHVPAPGP